MLVTLAEDVIVGLQVGRSGEGDARRGFMTVPPNVGEPLKHQQCNMRCGLPVGGGRWCARAGASCRCDNVARPAIVHSPTVSDVRTSGLTCPDDSLLGDRLEAFL
jgi:hypothetical protein